MSANFFGARVAVAVSVLLPTLIGAPSATKPPANSDGASRCGQSDRGVAPEVEAQRRACGQLRIGRGGQRSDEVRDRLRRQFARPAADADLRGAQWQRALPKNLILWETLRGNVIERTAIRLCDEMSDGSANQVVGWALLRLRIEQTAQARVDVTRDRARVAQLASENANGVG